MFIDYVEIEISAGNGGHGCIAFRTEKYIPKGGPEGGDGGKGGDIIARADPQLTTLLDFRYKRRYAAPNGQPGQGSLKTGKSGEDVVLRLPVGTIIKDLETNAVIADLDEPDKQIVVARGGKGGHGNAFYKSPTNQSPRKAQDGIPGEQKRVSLELKLLADVGLVGKPNAGKSTILATVSAARPKIADYPFTTLIPNLGIVKLHGYRSCVMADIPGLIEGASEGKGLGHKFLRHIQRTGVIVYVIDINDLDIRDTLRILTDELEEFDSQLVTRPSLVVITKTDTVTDDILHEIARDLPQDVLYISAVARRGLETFLNRVEERLGK